VQRRNFIKAIVSATAWPLVGSAQQQAAVPVVGYLASTTRVGPFVTAFQRGLSERGYVEGKNVTIEYYSAEGQFDRLPALAADLVRRRVAVIVAPDGLPAALAAKAATDTIPIVFIIGSDPVANGLVASLSRPGGNVTGMTVLATGMIAKRLEILHLLVPTAKSMALLLNPANPAFGGMLEGMSAEGRRAARELGVDLTIFNARNYDEIEAAFANIGEQRIGALLVGADPLFRTHNDQIIGLAARYAIPAGYESTISTKRGGLVSYGTDLADISRQLGVYTGRILNGERPSDLPVMQPTKFELVINFKTAKALDLEIPPDLLAIADDVVE
jgi:putative tryptophan/tyrosine transport system substrate-binding protein